MPVFEQTYARWKPTEAPRARWWPIIRRELSLLVAQRAFKVLLIVAALPTLIHLLQIYSVNKLAADPESELAKALNTVQLSIDASFFFNFLQLQTYFVFVLLLYASSGLVCDDIRLNLVEVYFSKPLTARDYLVGKAATVLGLGLAYTALPALFLFVAQLLMSPGSGFWAKYHAIPLEVIAFSIAIVVPTAMATLACSAVTSSRGFAAASAIAILAIDGFTATLLAEILGMRSVQIVNVPAALMRVGEGLFGLDAYIPLGGGWAGLVVGFVAVVSFVVLWRRVRAVEVGSVSAVIQARDLSKWFGEVVALNAIDLEIGPGITGILGPNGAGKSTLMNLATGQLSPSKGTITMWGEPIRNNLGVLRRIGYLPEQDRFWKEATGAEFVTALAGMVGLSPRRAREQARRTIARVGLTDRADDPIGTYSRGMRQRIKLAQALVHDPDLLLLDEPMTGLDPLARQQMIHLLKALAGEGRTIIVSSHVLHEVESLTSEVVLLVRGRLLATGDVKHIRGAIESCPHTIRCRSQDARAIGQVVVATRGLMGLEFSEEDQVVTIRTEDPARVCEAIADAVTAGRITVDRMSAADDSLDAVFNYLVGGAA